MDFYKYIILDGGVGVYINTIKTTFIIKLRRRMYFSASLFNLLLRTPPPPHLLRGWGWGAGPSHSPVQLPPGKYGGGKPIQINVPLILSDFPLC